MCKGPADNCVVHDKQPDSDDEEVRGWASNRSLAPCTAAAAVCCCRACACVHSMAMRGSHCLPFPPQALDRRIAEALDCPCVEELKSGPCGELFVNTFTCYQKSRAEPKGCDCLDVSLAFAVSLYTLTAAGAHTAAPRRQDVALPCPLPTQPGSRGECSRHSRQGLHSGGRFSVCRQQFSRPFVSLLAGNDNTVSAASVAAGYRTACASTLKFWRICSQTRLAAAAYGCREWGCHQPECWFAAPVCLLYHHLFDRRCGMRCCRLYHMCRRM